MNGWSMGAASMQGTQSIALLLRKHLEVLVLHTYPFSKLRDAPPWPTDTPPADGCQAIIELEPGKADARFSTHAISRWNQEPHIRIVNPGGYFALPCVK